jgi:hypothetical protein
VLKRVRGGSADTRERSELGVDVGQSVGPVGGREVGVVLDPATIAREFELADRYQLGVG